MATTKYAKSGQGGCWRIALCCSAAIALSNPAGVVAQERVSQPGYEKYDAAQAIQRRHFSGSLRLRGRPMMEALNLLMQQHFFCGIGSDEPPGLELERWGFSRKISCVQQPSFDEVNCSGLTLSVGGSWPTTGVSAEQIYDQLETSTVKGHNVLCPWPQRASLQSLVVERPQAEVKFAASIEQLALAGRPAREAYAQFMKDRFNCGLEVKKKEQRLPVNCQG